jgi:hypothetical protein
LYVDNSAGLFTADEIARINDAVASVDAVVSPYGVTITEVIDNSIANVTLDTGSMSAVGGYADGVLGCTTDSGEITIIQGWNFYAGSGRQHVEQHADRDGVESTRQRANREHFRAGGRRHHHRPDHRDRLDQRLHQHVQLHRDRDPV